MQKGLAVIFKVALVIFVAEGAYMLVLPYLELPPNVWLNAIVDASALTLVSGVCIYFFVIKPYIDAREKSEQQLSGLLAIAPDAIITTNEAGLIRMFNQRAQNAFGYKEDEVLGLSIEMLMPRKFRDGHAEKMATFKSSGLERKHMSERSGLCALRKDGSEFPAEASVSVLKAGDETLFNVILRDITERRRIERELVEARDYAEAANFAKSEFLANMSHDLRTPMNAILGFSEIMANEHFGPLGSERYKEYAVDIHSSGSLLLDLINDVLDLSKIEAGALELAEDVLDINEMLQSALRIIRGRANEKSIGIETILDPAVPQIRGDERAIKQIALNILSNSAKFTGSGGTITVSSEINRDGRVSLIIADTGIGIAPSDIPKVLEPFGQAGNVRARRQEGTGLGLSISKRLTELQGAEFELESEVGVGTTVRIHFSQIAGSKPGEPEATRESGALNTRRAAAGHG
ncbi:MAG: PAS domain S-box protein [Rhodospirillaceae bacterium]|jgi:PAS domain S-box-containing protein|nr:PAS domain S-box protein [Rhodospirillaceae bacterium]